MNTTTLILIATGLSAGILSGLFGIGGGVLIVPALVYLLGFSQHRATGTSLVVLLPPVGIAAVMEYARHGAVDWKAALVVAITVFIGAALGAVLANKISGATLKIGFSLFLLGLGAYSLFTSLGASKSLAASKKPLSAKNDVAPPFQPTPKGKI